MGRKKGWRIRISRCGYVKFLEARTTPMLVHVKQTTFMRRSVLQEASMADSKGGISVTGSFFAGAHAASVTLLRHPVTGVVTGSMFALALIYWLMAF
jgi:hypothetical protein